MTIKESVHIQSETTIPQPTQSGQEVMENQLTPTSEPKEITVVMEVVDMRIKLVQQRKQERRMDRTLRWPIHSNTHRVTF